MGCSRWSLTCAVLPFAFALPAVRGVRRTSRRQVEQRVQEARGQQEPGRPAGTPRRARHHDAMTPGPPPLPRSRCSCRRVGPGEPPQNRNALLSRVDPRSRGGPVRPDERRHRHPARPLREHGLQRSLGRALLLLPAVARGEGGGEEG